MTEASDVLSMIGESDASAKLQDIQQSLESHPTPVLSDCLTLRDSKAHSLDA